MTPLDPMAVATAVGEDLKENWLGFGLMGLGFLAAIVALVVLALLAFLAPVPGIAMEDDTLTAVGAAVAFVVYMGLLFGFTLFVQPLLTASMIRAYDAHLRDGQPLGFSAPFRHMRPRAGRVIGLYLVGQLLTMVGMLLLYVPGIVAAVLYTFAMPIVVLEDATVSEALSRAWAHMRDNAMWHLGVWATLFAAVLVAEITVVGWVLIVPLMVAWQVHAHHIAFPEAELAP